MTIVPLPIVFHRCEKVRYVIKWEACVCDQSPGPDAALSSKKQGEGGREGEGRSHRRRRKEKRKRNKNKISQSVSKRLHKKLCFVKDKTRSVNGRMQVTQEFCLTFATTGYEKIRTNFDCSFLPFSKSNTYATLTNMGFLPPSKLHCHY